MKYISTLSLLFLIMSFSCSSFAGGKFGTEPVKEEKTDQRCANRGERGNCKALIESWHFDPGSNSCKAFFWGGCGEQQPFASEEECLNICAEKFK